MGKLKANQGCLITKNSSNLPQKKPEAHVDFLLMPLKQLEYTFFKFFFEVFKAEFTNSSRKKLRCQRFLNRNKT